MKNKLTIGLLLLSLLSACTNKTDVVLDNTHSSIGSSTEILTSINVEYKENDLLMEYTIFETITFDSDTINYSGNNGSVDGSTFTITKAGVYKFSGSLDDGMIVVNTNQEEDVVIVLDNVSIHNEDGPTISVLQADKVIINLSEGSTNTLSDGSSYALVEGEDEPNATIYSKDDLSINGLGTLNIESNYNHGIYSKDDLKLVSGTINVTSINDGIKGKNYIVIKEASVNIVSNGDGLQSNNTEDNTKGFILIEGGILNINSGEDGIQAETLIIVTNGTLDITSGKSNDTNVSGKSLKASSIIQITDGILNLNSLSDDAIHSNNTIIILGGIFTIIAYDDALHADSLLQIDNGNIKVLDSYEGLEANSIVINGGDIELISKDDGINTAGGNDSSGIQNGRKDMFTSDGSTLVINGGNILINATGDGLDSNGSIEQNGGTIIAFGPINSGNGAIDYNASYTLNGGILLALGSNGMAQNVSQSKIYSFMNTLNNAQSNTWISIVQNEKVLISFNSPKAFQSIVYASNELKGGEVSVIQNQSIISNEQVLFTNSNLTGETLANLTLSTLITNNSPDSTQNSGQKPNRP